MNSPYNGKFRVTQEFKNSKHDGVDLVGIDSKNVHSTCNGVVEIAGPNDPNGFGTYVRIRQDNTGNLFYYGHLSQTKVVVGQRVKNAQLIGVEGNTGRSTGSHCHYCVRNKNNGVTTILDINKISGIPNKIGVYIG